MEVSVPDTRSKQGRVRAAAASGGTPPAGPCSCKHLCQRTTDRGTNARPVKAHRPRDAHCPSDLRRPWEGFLPKSASASREHTPVASDGPASWRAPGRMVPCTCVCPCTRASTALRWQSPCGNEGSGYRREGGRHPGAGARKAQKERAIREAAVRGAQMGASRSAPARRSAGAHGVFFISES